MRATTYSLLLASVLIWQCSGKCETNHLAIYIVSSRIPTEALMHGTATLEGVKLHAEPALSDKDFVSYDRSNCVFVVTAKAAKRLANNLTGASGPTLGLAPNDHVYEFTVLEKPLVVMAEGRPVYIGVFSSPFSSKSYAVPSIIASIPFLEERATNSVKFIIRAGVPQKGPGAIDVRNDQRILQALDELRL